MTDEIKTIGGIAATVRVKTGWRLKALGKDRLVFTHPEHEPRVVELASINEGEELPRDDDMVIGYPPGLTGK